MDNTYEEKVIEYNYKLQNSKEKWKYVKINDIKTHYKISNFGKIMNTKTGMIKDFSNYKRNSYVRFSIFFNKKRYTLSLHRLVAMYFCKIPKKYRDLGYTMDDLIPNHRDGIKHHNASFNLEWVTYKDNMHHAFNNGLCTGIYGDKSHLSKMKEQDAITICELIMERKTNNEIVSIMMNKHVNVSNKMVQHIRSKECWKKISSKYEFPKLAEAKHYTISTECVHKICKLLENGNYKNSEIAKMCGVKREYVKDIKSHRLRKDISKFYNF